MLHNDMPTRTEIRDLAEVLGKTSVSLYVPTGENPLDFEQARVRLRQLAKECVETIPDQHEHDTIEASLRDLLDDDLFWRYQSRSLAVFATADLVRTYRLPNRIAEAAVRSDRMFIKPLLRAVTFPQNAFVLALAQSSARLVGVFGDRPAETIDTPDLPDDAADSVHLDSISGRTARGRLQGDEGRKVRLRQYARAVDTGLRPILTGRDQPLVLAAAEPIASLFRAGNSYPHLLAEGIAGNPEGLSDEQLAARSREILDCHYAAELAELTRQFEDARSQGRAQVDLSDTARSATYGIVHTLFVDMDAAQPGTVDDQTGAVAYAETESADSYGITDEIARRALLSGARVYSVRSGEVPEGGPVAAVLRYAP